MMSNQATDFLKKIALKEKFDTYDCLSGEIEFSDSADTIGANTNIYLSSGSVYCFIAIKADNSDIEALFEETGNTVNEIQKNSGQYLIYCGKDINPGSRIAAHVRPRTNTGNAELEKISALRNFQIIYGSVYVQNYLNFEQLVHKKHPPLIGSPRPGKKSKYTFIEK